ncbi:hypothetical protein GQ55_1G229600 [Panicum hallii var. hallii]|uniref:Uncharacterized protein n=1 Tax=Panicum hallii var. hallii TaxID=1504633 RepID=A0A2T7F6M4_9POAL|nr:hypothetical protein GQ55_1G229600 [Panicum hallii var. hallii]
MISDQQKWRGQNGKLHAPILSRLASPPPPPAMAPPHSCGEPPSNGQTLPVTRLIACYHVPLAPSPLLHLQVPARWSGGGADGGLQLFRRTCARGALRPQPPTLPTHPLLHLGAAHALHTEKGGPMGCGGGREEQRCRGAAGRRGQRGDGGARAPGRGAALGRQRVR